MFRRLTANKIINFDSTASTAGFFPKKSSCKASADVAA